MSLLNLLYRPIFAMQSGTNDLIQMQMKRATAHIINSTKRVLVMTILLVASFSLGFTQGWEISFGGENEDQGVAILQTVDEGYIEVGFSESFGSDNDFDIYIVRTDVDGTLVWSEVYDEANVEQASDLIQLEDQNYLVLGYINDTDEEVLTDHVYLMKVNDKGELLWTKRYNNNGLNQRGQKIITTADGGYAIIGQITTASGNKDILLIKLDSNADEVWRETYGTPYTDSGKGLVEVEDGFVFAANVKGDMFPDNDVAIYRVNESGSLVSLKVHGTENDNEEVNDLIKTSDGNIVLVGSSDNFNKAYIIKSDLNGDTLWTREIVETAYDDVLISVIELEDQSIVAVGQNYAEVGGDVDVLLLKLLPNGDLVWRQTLGEEFSSLQYGEDVVQSSDGSLVIAGYSAQGAQVFGNDLTIIKLDEEGNFYTNLIEGKVFWSDDGCNPFEEGDIPLNDWLVNVEGADNRFVGSTDAEGNYSIPVDIGEYTVTLLPKNDTWDVCSPSSFPVTFTATYDTLVYNFPVRSAVDNCPVLTIDASTGGLITCETTTYVVEYCNDGSALAENTYAEILLDEELTFVDASIPFSMPTADSLILELGDLLPLACGEFTVTVEVACDVENLQSVAFSANIAPTEFCGPINPDWDGAILKLTGRCEGEQVVFSAKNIGDNPMSTTLGYVIVEDVLMFLTQPGEIPVLNPGEEQDLPDFIPANAIGSTYRIIATQSEGAPGNNFPTVAVEGCLLEGNTEYTTGVVTQFPENDQDPYIDIDVQEILSTSGSANIMIGHPKGYQDSIIISNTDLEYTVLFANTEVDTLNRLVIRDTLPTQLDLASLSVGPASHPYTFEIYNGGILKITFTDLSLLPDGSGTATDSRGFVKFSLSQKQNLPLGTVIENSAAVYFDFVAPIITNKVRHVLACENFLTVGCITVDVIEPSVVNGINIRIQPNPLHSSADFIIEGCECGQVEMILRNALGQEIRRELYAGPQFTFQRRNLPPALYFLEIRSKGQLLQTSKLLIQ